jgi:hypothetical protein
MILRTSNNYARLCDKACQPWPDLDEYETCPVCQGPTRIHAGAKSLPEDTAASLRKHAEFDRYYREEWQPDEEPLTDYDLELLGIPNGGRVKANLGSSEFAGTSETASQLP